MFTIISEIENLIYQKKNSIRYSNDEIANIQRRIDMEQQQIFNLESELQTLKTSELYPVKSN
jgi:hypothetical protein